MTPPVDALLLVSFGGPEGPDDVGPFLENVTRGRGIPAERLVEVGRHYQEVFGGVSPLNGHNRELLAAVGRELARRGPALPVYWGNRNWHPLLPDTLRAMRDDGVRHALTFVTSAYSSYSGCRQYREDLERARDEVGDGAPLVTRTRHYYNHPGFVEPQADRVREALARLPGRVPPRLVFTAHSVPVSMAATAGPSGGAYERQLRVTAALVAERVGGPAWDLVWQSRSGPPQVPWLEPDVGDHVRAVHAAGEREVVVVPVGFTSDHVEVVYDLDVALRDQVADLPDLTLERAATVGTDPRFVAMVRDLVAERVSGSADRLAYGIPSHDLCPRDCCPAPQRPR